MSTEWKRRIVAVTGAVVVIGYAVFAAVIIVVLEPLAAVPGESLQQINATLTASGESLAAGWVIGAAAVACLVAVTFAVAAVRGRWPVLRVVETNLALLILAAPAFFMVGFGPGMSLSDVYLISGEAHSPWGGVLYLVSGVALVVLIAAVIVNARVADKLSAEGARR